MVSTRQRQQHLQPLSRELLAPWNGLELVAHHALESDALVMHVVDAANPEPEQKPALRPPAALGPARGALRVGRGSQPDENLPRLKVDPLRRRMGRPHVVEVAVLLRHVLQQRHVLHLAVGVGGEVSNLGGAPHIETALGVLGDGAHDGPIRCLDQSPRRAVVLERAQIVADVNQSTVVLGEHPVLRRGPVVSGPDAVQERAAELAAPGGSLNPYRGSCGCGRGREQKARTDSGEAEREREPCGRGHGVTRMWGVRTFTRSRRCPGRPRSARAS